MRPGTGGKRGSTGQHRRAGIGLEERAPVPDMADNPAICPFGTTSAIAGTGSRPTGA